MARRGPRPREQSEISFGDITFEGDIGPFFSVIVVMTGIIMLLVVLPFAFNPVPLCAVARGTDPQPGAA